MYFQPEKYKERINRRMDLYSMRLRSNSSYLLTISGTITHQKL